MSVLYPVIDLDDLYRYLVTYMRDHDGAAPTRRRIAADMGLSSTSTAARGLDDLEVAGRIEIKQMVAGGIRLARPPRCECCGGIDYARLLAELEPARAETRDREAA